MTFFPSYQMQLSTSPQLGALPKHFQQCEALLVGAAAAQKRCVCAMKYASSRQHGAE
jgi:hypothetical protein